MAIVSPSRMSKLIPLTAYTLPIRRFSSAPLSSGKVLVRLSTASIDGRCSRGMAVRSLSGNFGTGKTGLPSIMPSRISEVRMQAARCLPQLPVVPSGSKDLGASESTRPSGGTSPSSGSASRHSSIAIGQRGANGQPGGRLINNGGLPLTGTSGVFCFSSTRGIAASSPIEYGIRVS